MISRREAENIKKNEHSRMGSKGIGPEKIREFSFNQMGRLYAQLGPNLWSIFCQLCKIDEWTAEAYLEGDTPDFLVEGPHAPEDEQGAQHKQKRRSRQKALSVVLMMGLTAFCRSRESNVLQTMIGFYLFSTNTRKRVMGVFDHLGICISYDAVREALRNNAQKVRTELCARASGGQPILLTYDNLRLTNKNNAASETLWHKSVMYCFTAAAAARVFLRMPRSLAIRIGKDPDMLEAAGCLESWTTFWADASGKPSPFVTVWVPISYQAPEKG
jgi:hypothetical protein